MAERRMISKTISTSRKVSRLSERAALIYTWLIPHTDDFGRLEGDAFSIKAKIVPMLPATVDEVEIVLAGLESFDLIKRYEVNGEKYLEIVDFTSFQTFRTDRPRRPEYPGPDGKFPDDSQRYTNDIPVGDISRRKLREGKVREVKGSEGKKRKNAASAAPALSKPSKPKSNPDDVFTLPEYIASMRSSPHRFIRLIGEYADEIKPELKTKGQWEVFTRRNVRAAKELAVFSDDQLELAMGKLGKNLKSKLNPKGFITDWSLETLLKYITK